MLSGKQEVGVRKIAWIAGGGWVAAVVALGAWLSFREAFFNAPGILFPGGYGDIWILAVVALPGYFLWNWGRANA